jgi:dihydrofolate reductase
MRFEEKTKNTAVMPAHSSSPTPQISIIVAMAENRVIGANNTLPWHLPADLRHFRRLTTGHHIIMGRKNYESIGKPLPDRINIVVSRNRGYHAPGCRVVHSLDEGLIAASGDTEIFVIGGGQLYRQTLGGADRLYLTLIHGLPEGDTSFPDLYWNDWNELERERHEADARHAYAYSFITLERKKTGP